MIRCDLYIADNIQSKMIYLAATEKKIPMQIHLSYMDGVTMRDRPRMVDRGLELFGHEIIYKYLEERHPSPSLFPDGPTAKAEFHKMLFRIKKEIWDASQEDLLETINSLAPAIQEKPYFLSGEFSILDCAIAPILIENELPWNESVLRYITRIYDRDSVTKMRKLWT